MPAPRATLACLSLSLSLCLSLILSLLLSGCSVGAPQFAPSPGSPGSPGTPAPTAFIAMPESTWTWLLYDGQEAAVPWSPLDSSEIRLEPGLSPSSHFDARWLPTFTGTGERGLAAAWNRMARALVAKDNTPPPMAARTYALLSLAQHDAWVAAKRSDSGLSPEAALVAASAQTLIHLYLFERPRIESALRWYRDHLSRDSMSRARWASSESLGRRIGSRLIVLREYDGYHQVWNGAVPEGEAVWYNWIRKDQPGLLPTWGRVHPFLAEPSDSALFLPPPPPDLQSHAFGKAISEVKAIALDRSPHQLSIAFSWADGVFTPTPPGHWNAIACALAAKANLGEGQTARLLAFVNLAMMDAGIWCWKSKYAHWLLRPSMADPKIRPCIPVPMFPSYPSGHASFSAAAAAVIGGLLPAYADTVADMSLEAAESRLYAGVHYRFDNDAGLWVGRKTGELALRREKESGRPLALAQSPGP